MLILHGYEDDNVVAAHAVRLSEALSAHGIPHASILLSSLTHVARSAVFAQLQHMEMEFLDAHLRPARGA
jgi:dipeptidyl-peptidase 4